MLKSRRLLISWLVILRFFHKAQFSGMMIPGTSDAYSAAIMSTDEDSVKKFIAKIYAVYDIMPDWLKELNPIVVRNALQTKFKLGGEIDGYSLKQSGARGPGYTEVLFDEAAFQMFARTTYAGTRPTIGANGRIIVVSTPNGKRNFFYEMWSNAGGQYSAIKRMQLDWNVHPDRDEAWFAQIRESMSKQDFAREYLCSFTQAAGRAVYEADYDTVANESDNKDFLAYNPDRAVFIGWDLGFYNPAVVCAQMNHKEQLIVQHEFFGCQEDIWDFANRFREKRAAWYPGNTDFIHLVPPDVKMSYRSTSLHGHNNDYSTLFGPRSEISEDGGVFLGEQHFMSAKENDERLGAVRAMMKLRKDGNAGLIFSKQDCPELIDGAKGGYAYPPEDKIVDVKKIVPEKGDYSHLHDALQAICTGYKYVKLIIREAKKTIFGDQRRIGYKTGM